MRSPRVVAGLMAIIAIVFGFGLATASPAAAASETGTWRAYGNTNPITSSSSSWHCASSVTVTTNVIAQVCAVRSASGSSVQGAVIVRNNRSALYAVTATMDLYVSSINYQLGVWTCPQSGVGARSWSVCFGRTITEGGAVNSLGFANGVYLGKSPNV